MLPSTSKAKQSERKTKLAIKAYNKIVSKLYFKLKSNGSVIQK
jgi:hypothetical protein